MYLSDKGIFRLGKGDGMGRVREENGGSEGPPLVSHPGPLLTTIQATLIRHEINL